MASSTQPIPENGYTNFATKVLQVNKDGNPIDSNNPVAVGIGGLLNGLTYDYVGVSYPSDSIEIYVFKQGGVSGVLKATITLTFVDSTKERLASVEKI